MTWGTLVIEHFFEQSHCIYLCAAVAALSARTIWLGGPLHPSPFLTRWYQNGANSAT